MGLDEFIEKNEYELEKEFKYLSKLAYINHKKVLSGFWEFEIKEFDFFPSSGYGYFDSGREKLDNLFAYIFKAESGFVRFSFLSGTHAIALALLSIIDANVLIIPENIYDTILPTFLHLKKNGYLLIYDNLNDFNLVIKKIKKYNIKYIYVQKSKGYFYRRSFSNYYLKEFINFIKKYFPDLIFIIDNCYGEFTEDIEPIEAGFDLAIGSLIKNLGGGIAPSGAYIVGKKPLIDKIVYYYYSPSLEKDMGATLGFNKQLFMGLYYSPLIVYQSLKGIILFSKIFSSLGYEVLPDYKDKRFDIVQAIKIGDKEKLINMAQFIQSISPIDSNAVLSPVKLPGYKDKIVMAAGTFNQGASLEFSADAPIREPYILYIQGGISYFYIKYVIKEFLQRFGGI